MQNQTMVVLTQYQNGTWLDNVSLGKQLHEKSYKKEKEFLIDNLINVDFIKNKDPIEIHEVKKTQSMEKSHEFQLLYYMYYLKNEKDIDNTVGYLNYPSLRKEIKIELTEEKEVQLEEILEDIANIINSDFQSLKKQEFVENALILSFALHKLFLFLFIFMRLNNA